MHESQGRKSSNIIRPHKFNLLLLLLQTNEQIIKTMSSRAPDSKVFVWTNHIPVHNNLQFHLQLSFYRSSLGDEAYYSAYFYFHVSGSIGIVQKIEFEIRPDLGCTTFKTSRKVVLDNPSVCLSCCILFCKLSRAQGLTDQVETLGGVCSVTWGITPNQFLRRSVNPFIR